MKKIIIGMSLMTIVLLACNNRNNNSQENKNSDTSQNKNAEEKTTSNDDSAKSRFSIKEIVQNYLKLKNALVNDNGKLAAAHGKAMVASIDNVDAKDLTEPQKKLFVDAAGDAKEHAEHISESAEKIDHQREHFDMLSKDVYDLVKMFKPAQTLYKDFCPMHNDNKGAIWLSETKEIKNPYMGKKMPLCGVVKEEIHNE